METIIERAALALCRNDYPNQDINGCRDCLLDFISGNSPVRKQCAAVYDGQVRAVLAAIREPTDAMTFAADDLDTYPLGSSTPIEVAETERKWQAMIDVALSDTPPLQAQQPPTVGP